MLSYMKTWVLSIFGLGIFGLFLFWLFKPTGDAPLPAQVLPKQNSSALTTQEPEQANEVKAVDYDLSTFDGQQVSLASINQDKPVVIQVWATWCHICEKEFPENNVIAQKYQNYIAFHAVNIGGRDQTPEAIKKYVERKNLDSDAIKFLVDTRGDVSSQYGFNSTPQHIFVEKGGVISYYKAGYMTPVEIEGQIQNLIEN